MLQGAAAATVFLTRVPLPPAWYTKPQAWRHAVPWFPLVGACVGAALAGMQMALVTTPPLVGAVIVVILGMLLTGALHEDGLGDTADALGGGTTREKVFMILKDSRVGSYGSAAIAGSIVVRAAAIGSISHGSVAALILSHMASRAAPLVLMAMSQYMTPDDVARSGVFARAGWKDAVAGWCVAILGAIVLWQATPRHGPMVLTVMCFALGTGIVASRYFRRRLGGFTGDLLGAAQQVAECGALILCSAYLKR
jgi:adenosylcobinamide-GDP ribazoletransferase